MASLIALTPIDRITQAVGPTVAGATATVQSLYDSFGRVAQHSMPYTTGATEYWQTFAYDVLNRLLETERPVSTAGG